MNIYHLSKTILLAFPFLCLACQSASTTETPAKEVALASVSDSAPEKEIDMAPEIAYDSTITDDYLMGRFDPEQDQRFVRIATKHADRGGMLLRQEAYDAFVKMAAAAASENIQLTIISATRNFDRQKQIWEAKWTGKRLVDGGDLSKTIPDPVQRARKILQWSSMPGSSRHHWGTDIDINNLENKYFASGKGKEEYDWLVKNAPSFGFCQPYSPKGDARPHGYNEEKWHWSFLPLAVPLTNQVRLRIKNEMIKGFAGAETASSINIVDHYILGINQACL